MSDINLGFIEGTENIIDGNTSRSIPIKIGIQCSKGASFTKIPSCSRKTATFSR